MNIRKAKQKKINGKGKKPACDMLQVRQIRFAISVGKK